jgi:uncharacterized membrane protein
MDMKEPIEKADKETARLEAFSDGVFGVAITLLAIEITVPKNTPETNEGLLNSIFSLWTLYLAYFNSFATLLLMWIAHHSIFKILRRTSVNLMLANGLLLLVVALVPFPTKTLGAFINTPAKDTAILFYTGYFILISIAFNLLMFVATRKKTLIDKDIPEIKIKQIRRGQQKGFLFNLLIFIVAFFSPWIALAMSFATWIYWALIMKRQIM